MGAVLVYMDSFHVFTVKIAAERLPFFHNQTGFSCFFRKVRKCTRKQSASYDHIIILFHVLLFLRFRFLCFFKYIFPCFVRPKSLCTVRFQKYNRSLENQLDISQDTELLNIDHIHHQLVFR